VDVGLIVSLAVAVAAAEALSLVRRPLTTDGGPTDAAVWAMLVGVIVGRIAAMAFDDPTSLGTLRDLAALRGGVEFWPGLVAGTGVLAVAARREGVTVERRIADLAPYGLMAMAGYQMTCFVREGCFGPVVPVGIVSGAAHEQVLPVEVVGAFVLVAMAVLLVRHRARTPVLTIALALWGLAVQRAVVSFWLPVVGDDLSRAHRESIAVTVISAIALIVVVAWGHPRREAIAQGISR